MFSLIFGIFSCDSSGNYDYNDVFIRFDNQTGLNIDRITLGVRLNKPSGIKYIEFGNVFKDVGKNNMTEYVNTKGLFNGYSNVVIHYPEGQRVQNREMLTEQLKANNAFEDSFENPLINKTSKGLSLPKGNYTYRISLHEKENQLSIKIIKDK